MEGYLSLLPFSIIFFILFLFVIIYLCIVLSIYYTKQFLAFIGILVCVRPLLDLIPNTLILLFREHYEKIKENIRKLFITKGNLTIKRQAIYSFHPHGASASSLSFNILNPLSDWPYKNIKLILRDIMYEILISIFKELNNYVVSSNYASIKDVLKQGKSLSLYLGGQTEMFHLTDYKIVAKVKGRRGIFKMAIENGVPIVPVLVYGENELTGNVYRVKIPILNITLTIPSKRFFKNIISVMNGSLKDKIYTHVGDPIEVGEARTPTEEEIVTLRERYIQALHELYKNTKPEGYAEHLEVI
jgi:hypothetical protein